MPVFRIHFTTGRKLDVEAANADQARKIASDKGHGPITKIKRVREMA